MCSKRSSAVAANVRMEANDARSRGRKSRWVAAPASGLTYVFPKAGEHLEVDGRDVAWLLSLGGFVIAGD